MDFAIIWISFAVLSVIATLIVYGRVIPSRISKMPVDEQEKAYRRARTRFYYAQLVWLAVVLVAGIIMGNPGLVLFAIFGFGWTYLTYFIYLFSANEEIAKMDARQRYESNERDVLMLLAFAVITGLVALLINTANATQEAEDAQYNQVVAYHLDSNNNKLEGEPNTSPISNLRTSNNGNTYSWLERKGDGTLVPVSVNRGDGNLFEVTLKDDLPATSTEARVERIVEYKVKGADVAAGKEVCAVNDGYGYNRFFHALPECGEGKTKAEFSKSRTIIHIPAGSMDKMVAMTSE